MNFMCRQSQHDEICILTCIMTTVTIRKQSILYGSPSLAKSKDLPNHTGSGMYLDHNQEDFFEDGCRTLFCAPLHQEHLHQKV